MDLLNFSGRKRIPVILQTEMAECGLACLAMISSYHGHPYDLVSLRNKCSIPITGANLKSIIRIADQLNLSSRPIKVAMESLSAIRTPAILHWDMSHFVVLEKVNKKSVLIVDPFAGRKELSFDSASEHFTGVALEVYPANNFSVAKEETELKFSELWGRLIGAKEPLVYIFVLTVSLNLFLLLGPLYVQMVVDEAVASKDLNLLVVLALGFALILFLELILKALRSFVILALSSSLSLQVTSNVFRHLLRLPIDYFEKRHIGDITSRFGSVEKLQELFTTGFVEALVDGLISLAMLLLLFLYSPMLATIVFIAGLLYFAIRLIYFSPFKSLTEEAISAKAVEQTNFMETIRGIQTIKLYGGEILRKTIWQNRLADYINKNISLGRYSIAFSFSNGIIFGLENILTIALGANLVLANILTIGMLYAFLMYKRIFLQSFQTLIEKGIEFKMARVHLQRIADIVKSEPEDVGEMDYGKFSLQDSSFQLSDVAFRYSMDQEYLFRNVNMTVNPGDVVAIIGPSGCGKTTLLKLFLGLHQPETGLISINGKSLNEYGIANYRANIGSVLQEDKLFSGSVFENISLFDSSPDRTHVEQCAKMACILTEMQMMPMGLNTLVGDMGSALSGGQRQRIFLARALYRKPEMLLLDEATSHLDQINEKAVNESLDRMKVTRIFIAHRPSTIQYATRFFSISDRTVSELTREEALRSINV